MLYLCGYRDAERQRLSDATCTALQLANFWQDVTVDLVKDRVYLPLELLERTATRWRNCSRAASTRGSKRDARSGRSGPGSFRRGCRCIGMVDRRLALDLDLFSRGGMRVLDKIRSRTTTC